MSSELKTFEAAIEYAKACNGDTNVYYTKDPFPHGHWHVVWADSAAHYNKQPGYELRAKISFTATVELVDPQ